MSTQEGTFKGIAGRRISWLGWAPDGDTPPAGVVTIAHGYGEHSGRYEHVAGALTAAGFQVYALDHHGHGRSEGKPGRVALSAAVADLDQLIVTVARERHGRLPQFLIGHSMGGAVALRYAISHQDRLAGLVLSSPLAAISGPALQQRLAKTLGLLAPGLPATRIDPALVSRDPDVVSAYKADPLNYHGAMSAAVAREFVLHAESLPVDVRQITIPTLLMWGTEDGLCPPAGAQMVADQISSTDLTTRTYEGLYHEIFNEPEREQVIADMVGWITAHR